MTLARRNAPLIVVALALVALPPALLALGLTMTSAAEVVIFAMACMALNVLAGRTGLVSFGHGAWFEPAAEPQLRDYATVSTEDCEVLV
ncbi:MAG: hypothetical protein CVT71_00620, partial [Alphaproteobacteria bacterium HGW-Alphaproteobacteria-10]